MEIKLREDLNLAKWAKEQGFKVMAPSNNTRAVYREYDPDLPTPIYDLSFEMNNCQVWKTRSGWRYADLIEGHYVNHSDFFGDLQSCLIAVLEREKETACV